MHRRAEPYPAQRLWLRVLDKTVLVVGTVGPLMTLPQILLIYTTHNATGVSPISWGAWAMLDLPWVIYGLAHRDIAIMLTYTLWCVMNITVCVGAVLYG